MMVLRAATSLRQLNYFATFLILRNSTFTIVSHLNWALSMVLHTYKANIGWWAVWDLEALNDVAPLDLCRCKQAVYICINNCFCICICIFVFVRVWSLGPLNHFAPFPPCESGRALQSKVADKAHSKTIISQPQKRGIRPDLKICFDDNHCWQKRAFWCWCCCRRETNKLTTKNVGEAKRVKADVRWVVRVPPIQIHY